MSEKQIDWAALSAPFHKTDVKYRIQSVTQAGNKALLLPYISSRSIMERLDSTPGIGPENWKDEYEEWHKPVVGIDPATATLGGIGYNGQQDSKAIANLIETHYQTGHKCRLSIRVNGEWLTKEGVSQDSEVQPLKGGASGALKRSAVKFGIGRYLYNLPDIWVSVSTEFQQGAESAYYKGKYYYYAKPDLRNFGAGDPGTVREVIPITLGTPGATIPGGEGNTVMSPGTGQSSNQNTGVPLAISEPEMQDLLERISRIVQGNKESLENYRQINDQPDSLNKVSKMLGCLYFVAAQNVPSGQHDSRIKQVMVNKNFGEMYSALKDILADMESGVYR